MPWEAKRWVVFAALMFIGSLWALTYEPDNVQRRSIIETEADRPTIPLSRPGPGETPPPTPPRAPPQVPPQPAPQGQAAVGAQDLPRPAADRQADAGQAQPTPTP